MVGEDLNADYFFLLSDLYDRFLSLEKEDLDNEGGK